MLQKKLLSVSNILRRLRKLTRLLRGNSPFHAKVHEKNKHNQKYRHDDRIIKCQLLSALPKNIIRHCHSASLRFQLVPHTANRMNHHLSIPKVELFTDKLYIRINIIRADL